MYFASRPRRETAVHPTGAAACRSEEHTSELQSQSNLVCRLLLEKKKTATVPSSLHSFRSSETRFHKGVIMSWFDGAFRTGGLRYVVDQLGHCAVPRDADHVLRLA